MACSELPDLKVRGILANFHIDGTVLVFNERFSVCANGGAKKLEQSFSKFGGRESVLVALFLFRCLSSLSTKAVDMYEKQKIFSVHYCFLSL